MGVVHRFLALRLGRAAGLGLFLSSLLMYRSHTAQVVFGVWSYAFTAVVALAAAVCVWSMAISWRKSRQTAQLVHLPKGGQLACDLAIFVNAIAYLISALDNPANAGRILYGNAWGSVVPAAALVEFAAMALWALAAGFWIRLKLPVGLRKPAIVVSAVIVTFLAAEGVARFRAALAPQPQGYSTFSSELWGRRYVRLNQLGFRDVDHQSKSPSDTRRLLILGDSYAFGWGINRQENRCGEQLAGTLLECTGQRWEVINAALPDTHTRDHIRFLEQALKFHPDAAVLLYVFNDIDYISTVTPRDAPPKTVLGRFTPRMLLFTNSYLFHEILVRTRLLYYEWQERMGMEERPDPYLDERILKEHMRDLSRLVSIADAAGVAIGVVPFDERVVLGGVHWVRYENFLRAAAEAGVPIWDPSAAFSGHEYSELIVNHLDRHPNERANGLVADAILPRLVESLGDATPFSPASGEDSQFCLEDKSLSR